MPRDEDDDLYDEEFDFVDDDEVDEDDEEVEQRGGEAEVRDEADDEAADESDLEAGEPGEEATDEYGRPEQPAANYVVHLYEHKKFTRTIDRPFTPEDAEAFATEFNRTSKNYGRMAVIGKNDAKPKKTID
jgi:hypothetical protein